MKSFRKGQMIALWAVAAVALLMSGCDLLGGGSGDIDFPDSINGVLTGSKAISLESTNLGEALDTIVSHDPEDVIDGLVPYLPVLRSALYNGTTPYITFTFNKAVKYVSGSTLTPAGDESLNNYVFGVSAAGAINATKRLSRLPVISGSTVTFYLPRITDHDADVGVADDDTTFVVGQKYLVDFYVQTTDGDFGRLTIAFIPKNADVELGTFGDADVFLYADSPAGRAQYSLYRIDQSTVFYLNRGTPATHLLEATDDETVEVDGVAYTTFTTYETRYENGQAVSGTVYDSLDALAVNGRTLDYVTIMWNAVQNATDYLIYTTETAGNNSDWEYVDMVGAGAGTTVAYNFYLTDYPINGYRVVRIVPINDFLTGTEGEIRLLDTINPVTDYQDNDNTANNYTVNVTYSAHLHGNAETEGEIYIAGPKNLGAIVQPDDIQEDYIITNVTGTLSVSTTATNGGIMPLSVAQVTVPSGSRAFQLGPNAVGVLDGSNQLYVYVHLRCYLSPSGSITYTPANTPITGNISVTYTDLSGNPMISRTSGEVSKNSGVLIYVEN